MGIFEDTLSGFEGQDNIDPVELARRLTEAHQQEISTHTAKIGELNGTIAEKESAIASAQADNQKWKAMNLDLALQIPGQQQMHDDAPNSGDRPDSGKIRIDDLFDPKVRNRHRGR